MQNFLAALAAFPSPLHTLQAAGGVHVAGEGADFAVDRITDVLSKEVKTEAGLLRYLSMLMALGGRRHLALLSTATRVRLQVRWGVGCLAGLCMMISQQRGESAAAGGGGFCLISIRNELSVF